MIINSIKKTKRLLVIDGGWRNCGIAGEIIASICEIASPKDFLVSPQRICLPDCPAPTSSILESSYYLTQERLSEKIVNMLS